MNSEDKTLASKLGNVPMIKDQCCVKLASSKPESSASEDTYVRRNFVRRYRPVHLVQSLLAILIFCFAGFVIYLTAVSVYAYPVFKTIESSQDHPPLIIEPLPEEQTSQLSVRTLYRHCLANQLDHPSPNLLSIILHADQSRPKRDVKTNPCQQNMEHCKGVIDSMWSIVSIVNSSMPYLQGFLRNYSTDTKSYKSKFVELVECLQCKNDSMASVDETGPGQRVIHEHSDHDQIKNNVDVVSNLLNDEARDDKRNHTDSALGSTTAGPNGFEEHAKRPAETSNDSLDVHAGSELDPKTEELTTTLSTTSTKGTMEYASRRDSNEVINATTLKAEETTIRTSRIADTERTTVALNVTDKPDSGNVMNIAMDAVHPSSQGHGKLSGQEREAPKGSIKPIFRDFRPRIVTKGIMDTVPGTMPTAETIKSTQQLQLTPTMSWVPYQVCFYGPAVNNGAKQSGPGQIVYPASSPGASYQMPLSQQRQGSQNSNPAPSYVQVQAQSVQFMPMQPFPGNSGQPGGQRVGPTGPATPNFPIFPGQTSPSGGGNSNKTPYYCTYIPAPTFQFPAIPGVSEYQRSSIGYDKDEAENGIEGARGDQGVIFGYSEACPSNAIRCGDGRRCILRSQWCDGQVDCNDASDETTCSCRDRISQERLCDGYFDCPHGEDETGCLGCPKTSFSCNDWQRRYTTDNCVPLSQRCDGVQQCSNGKDEMDCNILTASYIEGKNAFSIGYIEGYLHKNFKGQWYPVCTATKSWARDACASELGSSTEYFEDPEIKDRSVPEDAYQGPYLAEVNGQVQLIPSCMNKVIFVRCPSFPCGTSTFPHKNSLRPHVLENEGQDYSDIFDEIAWPLSKNGIDPRFGEGKIGKGQDDLVASQLRVVGGRASEPKAWPFLVAIYKNGLFYCGGVILNEVWVLTAAHCLDGYTGHYFEIQAGMLRRFSFSPMSQSRKARYAVIHPQYSNKDMKNDIGMIMLDDPLRFNRWVRPICLPGPEILGSMWRNKPEPNSTCVAIGWGATREHGPDPDHLREVEVPILPHCKHQIDRIEAAICAGYPQGGRDACQGDSGGPLLCRNPYSESQWYVAGVVSHGEGCGRPDEPGAYTRVSYFLDWIREITSGRGVPPLRRTPLEKCPGFSCEGGLGKCLPIEARCNGLVDCLDGEDEVNCRDYYPIYRQLDNYSSDFEPALLTKTANFSEEIPSTDHAWTNNTIDDTTDAPASAEDRRNDVDLDVNGSTTSTTKTSITSSDPNYAESGSTLEPILFPTIFTCTRLLQSIPIRERCNRVVDCEDSTDEMNCTCKEYLRNLKPNAICDGYADCDDLTDEQDCAICGQDEFLCKTSEKCIPMSKKCNGNFDCKFKEDELDCFTLTDGQHVYLDGDRRPFLNQEGFLTKYVDGKWRPSCHRPRMHRNQSTATLIGKNMCEYFGFSNLHSTKSIVVMNSTLETVAMHKGSSTRQESSPAPSLSKASETCLGLYVRCAPTLSGSVDAHLAIDASTGDRDYLWPWIAAIFVNGRYRCAALLLGPDWLLSAAKCLENARLKEDYTTAIVGYGAAFLHVDGPHQQISVVDEVHPMNNSVSILLHLKSKVRFSRHVQPLFVERRIYLSTATDTCVAVGTNENYETKSTFLRPVLQDCPSCQRCFFNITDSDCSESQMSEWSGTIFCRGKKGWYPAAVFQDNPGLCTFNDTRNMTSIDYINPYLLDAMDDPRKPIEASCNGFRCKLGQCIPQNRVCDGVPDCRDQQDEDPKYYGRYRKNCENSVDGCSCRKTELRCKNGKCVDKSAFCDGYVDCVDGSDEPMTCSCAEYLKLTAPERICDGVRHCLDKTDESPEMCPCTESSFKCKTSIENDTCIPQDFICDGTNDCSDGKDEKSCRKLMINYQNDSYYSGEVLRRSYGVWHSECFQNPLTLDVDASDLCKSMGYTSGSVNNEIMVMDEPMVPKRDDFYVVRINSLIWMILRDDKPLVTLDQFNETCHRAFVNCEFQQLANII